MATDELPPIVGIGASAGGIASIREASARSTRPSQQRS
jgi:hypothetical protein